MSSKLRSHNISETADNQSAANLLSSRSTRQINKTLSTINNNENNDALESVNLDSSINEIQSSVTHNQDVMKCQQLQLQNVQ